MSLCQVCRQRTSRRSCRPPRRTLRPLTSRADALAQRDREAAAAMADMHRDMAGHVVRLRFRRLRSACSDMHGICNNSTVTEGLPPQVMASRILWDAMYNEPDL